MHIVDGMESMRTAVYRVTVGTIHTRAPTNVTRTTTKLYDTLVNIKTLSHLRSIGAILSDSQAQLVWVGILGSY